MAPLIVLVGSWIVARTIGAFGLWDAAASWSHALRFALAAMFLFTAVSHFHPRIRKDLIRMVPPGMPAPDVLVTLTGVFELLGRRPTVSSAASITTIARHFHVSSSPVVLP